MSERSTITGRRSRFFNYLIKRSDGQPMLKEDRTVILDLLWDEKARKCCLMYAFDLWDSDRDYAVSILNSIADAEISTTPSELLSGLRRRPQEPTGKSTGAGKGEGSKAPQRPELDDRGRAKSTKEIEILGQKLGDAAKELGDAIGRAHSPETEDLARKVGVSPEAIEDAANAARRLGKATVLGSTAEDMQRASNAIKDALRQDKLKHCTCDQIAQRKWRKSELDDCFHFCPMHRRVKVDLDSEGNVLSYKWSGSECLCTDPEKADPACPVHMEEKNYVDCAHETRSPNDEPCKSCKEIANGKESSWEPKVDDGS